MMSAIEAERGKSKGATGIEEVEKGEEIIIWE